MEEYIQIDGVILKVENAKEAEKLNSDFINALKEATNANDRLLKASKAFHNFKSVYSIQKINAKQGSTEFTGFLPTRCREGGQDSSLHF